MTFCPPNAKYNTLQDIYLTMSKVKAKKLIHKLTYLKYESEEVNSDLKEFMKAFNEAFSEELEFKNSKKTNDDTELTSETEKPKSNLKKGAFHSLFKLIAKKTHPDHHGDTYADLFKEANSAFEERRWEELLDIAMELNIHNIIFTEEEEELVNIRAKAITEDLENIKTNSLVWLWGTATDDKEKLRVAIREAMGIDEEEFQEFVKNKP